MTRVIPLCVAADPTILTGSFSTEVSLALTVAPHVTWATVAPIVIHQLDTVSCPFFHTGEGQAFVDISFTPCPNIAWLATALKTPHFVHTGSSIVTSSLIAVIGVDFTKFAQGTMWAGALKTLHLIMAYPSILTRIVWLAVVNVIFTIWALESWKTSTRVRAYVIITCCTIHAWLGVAFSNLVLTV